MVEQCPVWGEAIWTLEITLDRTNRSELPTLRSIGVLRTMRPVSVVERVRAVPRVFSEWWVLPAETSNTAKSNQLGPLVPDKRG